MATPLFLQRASKFQAFLFLVFFLLVIILGFVVTKNKNTQTSTLPQLTDAPKEQTKLTDTLYLLTKAQNPSQFSKQYGITLKDDAVQVKVELNNPTYQLPKDFGIETGRSGNILEAWVKIDHLKELSEQAEIKSIQLPSKAIPLKN